MYCINSLCLLTKTAFSSYNIRTRFARHTIVKLKIKSQFDSKLVWKRKNNTYVEENTNRAIQLELLVSQIHLVATRSDPNRSIEKCQQQNGPSDWCTILFLALRIDLNQRFPNFFVRGTLQDNFSENGTPLKQTNNR